MRKGLNQKVRHGLFPFLITLIFLSFSGDAPADDDARKEAWKTIQESVEALWAGQEYGPALKIRQQSLRKKLEKNILAGPDLEKALEETGRLILNQQKTTRYHLKSMPERFQKLFSPYIEWEVFRKIIWNEGSTAIEDGRQAVIGVGTLAPAGTPWLVIPEKASSEIEALSNGKIIVRIYSGGVMGEDIDILRKIEAGQLDACGCTALGILHASPEISVFLLPGLFRGYDEIDYIFEKFRRRIDRSFEERGYLLASLIDTGYFHLFSKNRLAGLDDIRRSKVLTWFGTVETTLFAELGISAMPVSATELVPALSSGMADAIVAPAAWMLGMQAYQYADYVVKDPFLYSPAAVIVSAKTRERLQSQHGLSDIFSHNFQELLIFEFSSLEPEWKAQARRYDARCLEAFTTRMGMEAVTLPPEDMAAIEQAGKRVWAKLADRVYPGDLLEDILISLEEFRRREQ